MLARTDPPVRRVRAAAAVEDLCAGHQPLALLVSSPLAEPGAERRARCWVVGAPGAEQGVLTAVRVRPGLVIGSALLLGDDPQVAPALAALARRAGVGRLLGGVDHVGPIAGAVAGARPTPLEMLARTQADPPGGAWRERGRVAGPDDVPALVALYRRFELEILDPGRLEEAVGGLVARRRVVVAVEDGTAVAAMRVEARSPRWDLWAGLTVPPEHRGRGLSRVVDAWARELSRVAGRGTAGVRAPTNAVPHDVPGLVAHPWLEVRLPPTIVRRRARQARRLVRSRVPGAGASR